MSANTILQYEISRIPLVVLTQGGGYVTFQRDRGRVRQGCEYQSPRRDLWPCSLPSKQFFSKFIKA